MNEAKKQGLIDQLEKAFDELFMLERMIRSDNEEYEKQSMILFGKPDVHVTDPDKFQRAMDAGLLDPNKPPFNSQTWLMYGYTGKDQRLTYTQIEEARQRTPSSGRYDPYGGFDPSIFKGG